MGLKRFELSQFRNITSAILEPDQGLNLITGENAAGKTSLLESIFYISYGRSFRSSQAKHLISHDTDYFRVLCRLDDETTQIGLERNVSTQTIRVNHSSISRISELSTLLPVLALHPDSHQLISAGPEHRRQFLDWGVFHVEHHFLTSWQKYRKALSQRNAALKQRLSDELCSLWDKELVEHALMIESLRFQYLQQIIEITSELAASLFPLHEIELGFKRGWSADIDFASYLKQSLQRDKDKGYTQAGPHRADIKITVNGQSAQTSISRGQQKKLVCLLKIAQLSIFSDSSKRRCILLFDDLPAELDDDNQDKIMSILSGLNIQLFITAIQAEQINCQYWDNYKVFHVEHGKVTEQVLAD
ncbi:DNA recombination and repair protein RecF [hydrothermal vent metagenome]|uniref:DNA recombination and repair protein RecF n=1 Tax=hydrothermal vent metagenome TaxID=652676 RepID=A0A3B0YKX4_9ZZZZ